VKKDDVVKVACASANLLGLGKVIEFTGGRYKMMVKNQHFEHGGNSTDWILKVEYDGLLVLIIGLPAKTKAGAIKCLNQWFEYFQTPDGSSYLRKMLDKQLGERDKSEKITERQKEETEEAQYKALKHFSESSELLLEKFKKENLKKFPTSPQHKAALESEIEDLQRKANETFSDELAAKSQEPSKELRSEQDFKKIANLRRRLKRQKNKPVTKLQTEEAKKLISLNHHKFKSYIEITEFLKSRGIVKSVDAVRKLCCDELGIVK
jgi:hypothetical protein